MKQIIFIDHESLTVRRKQIFYIDELRQAGFTVKFWDCSQYFHPGMRLADTLSEPYACSYDSLDAIGAALDAQDIPDTIFVVEAFRIWKNRRLFRLLSDRGCYMVCMDMYYNAEIGSVPAWRKLLHSSLQDLYAAVHGRVLGLLYRIYVGRHRVKGYDLTVGVGSKNRYMVRINSPDWELYRQSLAAARPAASPYTVFADEYFPLHPDLQFLVNNGFHADPQKYRSAMTRFFDDYEARTGSRVVVAAHPKAEYDPGYFGDRPIIKYKTAELIRDAQAVLIHSSSSISYAIMYDKPLALLVTDDYTRTFALNNYMSALSGVIGLPVHNIDRDISAVPVRVGKEIREKYIYDYLTCKGIEERSNAGMLAELFSRI